MRERLNAKQPRCATSADILSDVQANTQRNIGSRDDMSVIMDALGVGKAMTRLHLLQSDLQSLSFALDDFESACRDVDSVRPEYVGTDPVAMARLFHHAKTFVCAMRRFARLLESAVGARQEYPPNVCGKLHVLWRENRRFFAGYTEPRNAIEHIDGEVTGRNYRFMNLTNDYLEVVSGTGVRINRAALMRAAQVWRDLMIQVERAADLKRRGSWLRTFLVLLAERARHDGQGGGSVV